MRPGAFEILMILVIILVVFGPQRLPEIARQISRAIREVKKVSGEFEREVRSSLQLDEDDYGGNFPTWKGPPSAPREKAEPAFPTPPPPPDLSGKSGGPGRVPGPPAGTDPPPPGGSPVAPPVPDPTTAPGADPSQEEPGS